MHERDDILPFNQSEEKCVTREGKNRNPQDCKLHDSFMGASTLVERSLEDFGPYMYVVIYSEISHTMHMSRWLMGFRPSLQYTNQIPT
jgi:hypothetical protein